jgi:putative membrane protein
MKSTISAAVVMLLVITVISCRKEDVGKVDAVQNSNLSGSQSDISALQALALNSEDSDYLKTSAEGSSLEVILGQVAQTHASDQSVKNFGKRMIHDHTIEHKQVKRIGESFGITLPDEPSKKQKKDIKELSQYYGSEFDKHYISYEVDDHKHDISDATKEIKQGKNERVENLAIEWTPILIGHLEYAEQVAKKVGAEY